MITVFSTITPTCACKLRSKILNALLQGKQTNDFSKTWFQNMKKQWPVLSSVYPFPSVQLPATVGTRTKLSPLLNVEYYQWWFISWGRLFLPWTLGYDVFPQVTYHTKVLITLLDLITTNHEVVPYFQTVCFQSYHLFWLIKKIPLEDSECAMGGLGCLAVQAVDRNV